MFTRARTVYQLNVMIELGLIAILIAPCRRHLDNNWFFFTEPPSVCYGGTDIMVDGDDDEEQKNYLIGGITSWCFLM